MHNKAESRRQKRIAEQMESLTHLLKVRYTFDFVEDQGCIQRLHPDIIFAPTIVSYLDRLSIQ